MKKIIAVGLAGVLLAGAWARASEHPEHPTDAKGAPSCSMKDIADAGEKWAKDLTKKAGSMKIYDSVQKKDLNLKFMKIHRERLSSVGNDTYFVCADFKAKDGTVYDIDLFMKGKDKDNLQPAGKPTIHKVNGKPRYVWAEKDGIWSQATVPAAGGQVPAAAETNQATK